MYNQFVSPQSFFEYPVDSVQIGIYKVSRLREQIDIAEVSSVEKKYALLPYQNQFVAFPMLHTCTNS